MAKVNMRWEGAEPVYRVVTAAAVGVLRVMDWRVRVFGAEHIPAQGPAVLAANHVGYLDFVFVGLAARHQGRPVRFMAKQEVFDHPVSGPLMRGMRHIPVPRRDGGRRALEDAVARLRRGQVVGIFPEATISPSFVPRAGKTGAARMAIATGAALVPMAVWGSQRILTKGRPRNFQRGIAIDVHAGPPVAHAEGEDAQAVTDRLMKSIATLVEQAERRYPQNPAGPADRWWLPAHLGGTAPTPEEAEAFLAEYHGSDGRMPDSGPTAAD